MHFWKENRYPFAFSGNAAEKNAHPLFLFHHGFKRGEQLFHYK